MRWNRTTILDEIRALHRDGADLSFNAVQEHHLALLRAATWNYGTWKSAIELAGFDYEDISRYRRWSRARVLYAIREHHAAGRDLSWRSVSQTLDPALAAAALRPGAGFDSWREAVAAAGISPDEIARYQHWTAEKVIAEIQGIAAKSGPLSSQLVQRSNQPLFCAARRRFKTWNGALQAAGIDPQTVTLRPTPKKTPKTNTKSKPQSKTKVRRAQLTSRGA